MDIWKLVRLDWDLFHNYYFKITTLNFLQLRLLHFKIIISKS